MKGKKIIKNKIKKIKKRIYLLERQPVNQTGSRVEPSQVPRIVKEGGGGRRRRREGRGERKGREDENVVGQFSAVSLPQVSSTVYRSDKSRSVMEMMRTHWQGTGEIQYRR